MSEPTIASVRSELRHAVNHGGFMAIAMKMEGRQLEYENAVVMANNFVAFGVNARLIDAKEASEWLEAIKDDEGCGLVLLKYENCEPA